MRAPYAGTCHSQAENGGLPSHWPRNSEASFEEPAEENPKDRDTCLDEEGHLGAGDEDDLHVRLTGNTARRKPGLVDTYLWDNDLPGFGLRIRKSGNKSWVLRFRRRGVQKWLTIGPVEKVPASIARSHVRAILADAAIEGLPGRRRQSLVPTLADYAPDFWRDYARHWKPSTRISNRGLLKTHVLPNFGDQALDEISRADVMHWRDEMAGTPGSFKNALPLLSAMLRYAELLGHRPKGSNPCRGVPRFRRVLKERYLTASEFLRLGVVLGQAEEEHPLDVAAIRLMIFTGARVSEIVSLQWSHVEAERLRLPDSKTGPRYIQLNSQALAVLATIARREETSYLFPDRHGTGPYRRLGLRWTNLRRRAAIPDVRLHDLRHSFASVAINKNVPLMTIGRLLGHVLPETTARYAHLMEESIADAAQRVCGGIAFHLGLAA